MMTKEKGGGMKTFQTVDEILDFAISREEEASQFYRTLAERSDAVEMREMFEEFAREEVIHREKLLLVKEQKLLLPARDELLDLRISRYDVKIAPEQEHDYQQALLLAIRKEKAARRLYEDLVERTQETNVHAVLVALAQEEAKHQHYFEKQYDNYFLEPQ
jgi:rubrerythrin